MSKHGGYPRLLLFSQPVPERRRAGSIVLWRLLRDWPRERLLVVGQAPLDGDRPIDCRQYAVEPPLQRLATTRLHQWLNGARVLPVLRGALAAPAPRAIATFAPEVVVSVMQGQPYYYKAHQVAIRRGVPHVLIVHDLPAMFQPVPALLRQRQEVLDGAIYRAAARRLCVSPAMEAFLRGQYGVAGEVLYPNRSTDLVPRPVQESARLRAPGILTIGYAGGLGYGYGDQLRALAGALAGKPFSLRVMTIQRPATPFPPNVELLPAKATPEEAWRAIQRDCDVLLLPYPFQSDRALLFRTHFPSKLTEYTALGMPIIIMGPADASGVRWGLENRDAALVVTSHRPGDWVAALEAMREDGARRAGLARGALAAGARDFDPAMIERQFLDAVRSAAAGTPRATGEAS